MDKSCLRHMSKSRHRVYDPPMSEIPDLLSTRKAARVLGVTTRTVQRLAASGHLPPAYRLDGLRGAFLFYQEDVHDLAATRRKGEPSAA